MEQLRQIIGFSERQRDWMRGVLRALCPTGTNVPVTMGLEAQGVCPWVRYQIGSTQPRVVLKLASQGHPENAFTSRKLAILSEATEADSLQLELVFRQTDPPDAHFLFLPDGARP